jgi:Flp pilus assembly protein TadG
MPRQFPRPAACHHRHGFARREDGTITILALFVFVAMLMVAGIAVDTMRMEHERVRMQGATDRAALAATTLRENASGASAVQIAEAYITAEGLGGTLNGTVQVIETPGAREVTLAPSGMLPTLFMRLVGVDEIPVSSRAQAIEAIGATRFEVVMALDVTGSMGAMTGNGRTRIENLRIAATDLVRSLLTGRAPGEVALSLVPYAEHVLPPAGFNDSFVNLPGGAGACPDFVTWGTVTESLVQPMLRRVCATQPWRTVRPFMHDVDAAVAAVAGLQANGTTSIDLGVRMGALFLDPSINGAVRQMIDRGQVHPAYASHPLGATAPGVVRAMILMTDGENCCGGRFPVAVQDAQALATCAALRAEGVTIYAVAFEAPQRGVDLMQGCASSPNHFFNTDGAGIADAFAAVASHIQTQTLRLTQ